MKIKIISDIHNDHNKGFTSKTIFDDTFTIIAGDISQDSKEKHDYLNKVKNGIWISGNHDTWTETDIDTGVDKWSKEFPLSNSLSFLENNCKEVNGIVFIGSTLWSDFNLHNNQKASIDSMAGWPDFMYNHIKKDGSVTPLTPADMIERFNKSVAYIESALNKYKDKVCVLITHFVTTTLCAADIYKNDISFPFFASNLDWLYKKHPNLKLSIFGHIHQTFDVNIDQCRIICNPRGYVPLGEGKTFEPNLTIDIDETTGVVTKISDPNERDITPETYLCKVVGMGNDKQNFSFETTEARIINLPFSKEVDNADKIEFGADIIILLNKEETTIIKVIIVSRKNVKADF